MQFMRAIVAKYNFQVQRSQAASQSAEPPQATEQLEALRELRLMRAFGAEPRPEHVEIDGKLTELKLAAHLPSSVWPGMPAVRELLATANR